ncbi:hypothetical protein ACFWBX_26750 [Streptomyces sp. NPDC059991]
MTRIAGGLWGRGEDTGTDTLRRPTETRPDQLGPALAGDRRT